MPVSNPAQTEARWSERGICVRRDYANVANENFFSHFLINDQHPSANGSSAGHAATLA